MKRTCRGKPATAVRIASIPGNPATLAISCGSVTTAPVPWGTTARANSGAQTSELSRWMWASMNEGATNRPVDVDPLVRLGVVADAGDAAVGDRDVGPLDLTREDVDDPPAGDDEVGRRGALGNGQAAAPGRRVECVGRCRCVGHRPRVPLDAPVLGRWSTLPGGIDGGNRAVGAHRCVPGHEGADARARNEASRSRTRAHSGVPLQAPFEGWRRPRYVTIWDSIWVMTSSSSGRCSRAKAPTCWARPKGIS